MQSCTLITVIFIITASYTSTTGTEVGGHKPDKSSSIEPLDEADPTTSNTTALERFRRLIPYMTYYLTQGVSGQLQFAQPLLQGHYNQYNPVNVVPNKLEPTQPRPMPLLGNRYVLRPLQQLYNQQQPQIPPQLQPQLQSHPQIQPQLQTQIQPQLHAQIQPQLQAQIQPQQLVQLKQLQPLGLTRFANYQQPQNTAPLQHQQPHYPSLPNKPFMESDFKPMTKNQHNHQQTQFVPKQQQQQYIIKEHRPQQITLLRPAPQLPLNYPKTIAASYAATKPQQNQQYSHQIPLLNTQRPVYVKAYQPHKALQQYLQEITPITKIQPVSPNIYSESADHRGQPLNSYSDHPVQQVKEYSDHQAHPVKEYSDHQAQQVKEYPDHQVKEYSDHHSQQVKEYSEAADHQISQAQQIKETNEEEEQNTDVQQTGNSYIPKQYMSSNQQSNDDEVMTITQSQEIIVPQEPPQQLQPDQATLELTELLEGYKLSKALPETITSANIGSSIRTLSQILKVLQRANALSSVSHPSEDSQSEYEDYANKAPPYSSTQTEASTPGRAGVDYPNYSEIPATAFNCKDQRYKGFFGDPETHCQVWHYCDLNGGQASFLCPNGTIFSQVALTCDWWFNVKCATTTQLYVLNERLYKYILPQRPSFPEDFAGPLVDEYLTLKYHELEAKKKNATAKAKPTITTTTETSLGPNLDFQTLQSLLTNEVKRNV